MEWMVLPYRRYAEFSGRSTRREYWMFTLLAGLVTLLCVVLMMAGGYAPNRSGQIPVSAEDFGTMFYVGAGLLALFWLGSFIPGIAVAVRRFHDRDMSGWWVIGFAILGRIPFIGWLASLANLVIMALPGTPGANRFGPDPLNPYSADVFN
ncbi:MAG: DUF805 domain-containing protein [Proteobacteria bacterium]|nr:DUF805 domain-containing protein [Pseudomonadota bacterium]